MHQAALSAQPLFGDECRMADVGTKWKLHRRLATSAFGGLTDIKNVVADFRI
jgi:hypothetical protein